MMHPQQTYRSSSLTVNESGATPRWYYQGSKTFTLCADDMAVGLKLRSITDEIGGQDFLHAFFSTVSYRLEENGWGTRFPCLLQNLYQGRLEQSDAGLAIEELDLMESELRQFPPEKVIWDIENLDAQPPWGSNISSEITDLSNYFVTSTGRDLISVLRECLESLRDKGGTIEIVSI